MSRQITRLSIFTFSALAVLYPLWARLENLGWKNPTFTPDYIFPYLGLAAFSLLWLHVIGPSFEPWLSQQINFEYFLTKTQPLILALILLHPLLLFVTYDFNVSSITSSYGLFFIRFAGIGLFLLLIFDIGTLFKKKEFVTRHWEKILIISTVGFILIFFHSLGIGSDLQSGPLRAIWIFYGVTAILSAIYVYGVKRLLA